MQFFFATGMFRSGTTLLARMLNAHPEIACASDPFAPVFKQFRNRVARDFATYEINPSSPLDDYFFDQEKLDFFYELQYAPLDIDCSGLDWDTFLPIAGTMARPYSPLIETHISSLPAQSFAKVFKNAFEIVRQAYGDKKTKCVGFKEVWTNEFAIHLLREFPEAKVVHMVRDPRAVVASNLASMTGAYPIMFLSRQWRKLASVCIQQSISAESSDRIYLLRFEDLIEKPEQTIHSLCDFLGVDFHERLIQPQFYRDGINQPWVQNSSHAQAKQAFNVKSLHKWQGMLSSERIAMIEGLCFAEMRWYGYSPLTLDPCQQLSSMVFDPPEVPEADVAGWLAPFADQSPATINRELALEVLRSNSFSKTELPNKNTRQRFGLWDNVYSLLHKRLHS